MKEKYNRNRLWPFISLFLTVIMDCYYGNLDPKSISFHSILLK